jgi:hypothetical protein
MSDSTDLSCKTVGLRQRSQLFRKLFKLRDSKLTTVVLSVLLTIVFSAEVCAAVSPLAGKRRHAHV